MNKTKKSQKYLLTICIAMLLTATFILSLFLGLYWLEKSEIGQIQNNTVANTMNLPDFNENQYNTFVIEEPFSSPTVSAQMVLSIANQACESLFYESLSDNMIITLDNQLILDLYSELPFGNDDKDWLYWNGYGLTQKGYLFAFAIDAQNGDLLSAFIEKVNQADLSNLLREFDYSSTVIRKETYYKEVEEKENSIESSAIFNPDSIEYGDSNVSSDEQSLHLAKEESKFLQKDIPELPDIYRKQAEYLFQSQLFGTFDREESATESYGLEPISEPLFSKTDFGITAAVSLSDKSSLYLTFDPFQQKNSQFISFTRFPFTDILPTAVEQMQNFYYTPTNEYLFFNY